MRLLGAPSSPHRRSSSAQCSSGRGVAPDATGLRASRTAIRPALHRHGRHNRAREAPPTAAAIIAAYSTVKSLYLVQPRHWPPLRVRTTTSSNRHAQRAALLRQSMANPLVDENLSKFCPQGQRRAGRARVPTTGRRSSSTTSMRWARRGACARCATVRRCCRARRRLPARR